MTIPETDNLGPCGRLKHCFYSTIVTTTLLSSSLALAMSEYNDPKKLNHSYSVNERLRSFVVSSDFKRALYRSSDPFFNRLYSAPVGRSGNAEQVFTSGYLRRFELSPDGKTVVYSTSSNSATSTRDLFSRPIDLSSPQVALSPTLASGRDIGSFQVTPDSNYLVFSSEEETNNLGELWSVPIEGPAASRVKISGDLEPPGGSSVVGASHVTISPDSETVVYVAKKLGEATDELFSVAIDGSSSPVKLSDNVTFGRTVRSVAISPDGSTVLFVSHSSVDNFELYAVPIEGPNSSAVKLNHDLVGGSVIDLAVSPDGNRVVYRASSVAFDNELYSVPIDRAQEPTKLNPELVTNGDVESGFVITPDSQNVIFTADVETLDAVELFSVPIAGPNSSAVKLTNDFQADQIARDIQVCADSSMVVFVVEDQTAGSQRNLFSTQADGSSTETQLNSTLVSGGNVVSGGFATSEDCDSVLYIADQEVDELLELFIAPIDGSEADVKVNAGFPQNAAGIGASEIPPLLAFAASPDLDTIVYVADHTTADLAELFSISTADDDLCVVGVTGEGVAFTICL